jgi:hypothetical protein
MSRAPALIEMIRIAITVEAFDAIVASLPQLYGAREKLDAGPATAGPADVGFIPGGSGEVRWTTNL